LFTWDDFEEMLKLGVLTRLVVSCDGDGTAESYEALRPPATWDGLIEFLTRVKALRDQYAPNLELVTRTVCPPEPAENRMRWRDLLIPLGWEPQFRRWMDLPGASVHLSGRKVVVPDGICLFVEKESDFPVRAWEGQMHLLVIDTDCNVVPCCQHPRAGLLGNLLEHTYNEILVGSQYAKFVNDLSEKRSKMNICRECDVGSAHQPGASFLAGMDVG
jgi:radical SAM protein with 4Fe4S-binding SPASM domain